MLKDVSEKIMWNKEWCKFCELCEKNCPKKAISFEGMKLKADDEKCIKCGICERVCPDLAIKVKK